MTAIIPHLQRLFPSLARLALFTVFAWFGVLKVFNLSPATPLVQALFDQTLGPWLSFNSFLVGFGIFEAVIGVMFLIPRWERRAFVLLMLHMITTTGPLVLLPHYVWQGWFIPSLEGQYIIKNVVIVALAVGLVAYARPLPDQR